ncbi:MAG TPA: sialate O-acetylesterase [Abditibacteriaceae bacterium]|jgi:sialate O-acetylesterase
MRQFLNQFLFSALLVTLLANTSRTQEATTQKPLLHPLFSDNVVLQRGVKAPIWGWAAPGQKITVALAGDIYETTAGADGKWMLRIKPLTAGGPYQMQVSGPQTATLNNVMAGDVWICSGQSNMQWSVSASDNPQQEIANANYPQIRLFTVPNVTAVEPQELVKGSWQVASPQTIAGFSAVAYYFGRELHQKLQIPIGLINTSWGGTIAEAWTSGTALKTMPDFAPAVANVEAIAAQRRNAANGATDYEKQFNEQMAAWWGKNDPGSQNNAWAKSDTGFNGMWQNMNLPGGWENSNIAAFKDFDGIAWFRREFEAPAAWEGKELTLHLGPIDDRDTTWINGVQVGSMNEWNQARDYKVPAGVVKPGRNVIAIRVLDTGGGGGLFGNADQMKIEGAGQSVALSGAWNYRISTPLNKTTAAPSRVDQGNPNVPSVLYNSMIAPLVPYGVKGAIWYQGESNAGRAEQYKTLLPLMIRDWKTRFGVDEFPFLIVQLANFMAVDDTPKDDAWPQLRDAQLFTAKTVPNAGLATAIDIGDAADIHPRNKQEVGRRLALIALAKTYGQKIEYSGPMLRHADFGDEKVRLDFDHAQGLMAKGGAPLRGFALQDKNGKWHWANAQVEGQSVVVYLPVISEPQAVRYAWSNNPVANLYNGVGLPAVPFQVRK